MVLWGTQSQTKGVLHMKKSCIYKIECLENKKVYIGQTVNPRKRWMEHKRTLNLNKHHSCLLQEDWNRYSEKSFEHTILGEYSLDDIDYHERNFIAELKSNNPEYGYNLCDGGNKNKTHHKITRELLRQQALSSHRWQGKNNPNYGGGLWNDERRKYYSKLNQEYWTEEARKEQSERMKSVYNFDAALEAVREPVVQLDLNGNYIDEYPSVTEAGERTSTGHTHISSCCNNKRKTAGGYIWVKKSNYETGKYSVNPSALEKNKNEKIVKLSLDGSFLETLYYKDIRIHHKTRIIDCCNGERSASHGYKWMRYDDYIKGCQHANTEVNGNITRHRNA